MSKAGNILPRLLVVTALFGVVASQAQDSSRRTSRRGEPVIFSGTATDHASTNISVASPRSNLKQLEEQISKPFDLFERSAPSLTPRMQPPVQTPQMIEKTKRSQEFLKRSKEDSFFDVGGEEKEKEEDPYGLEADKRKLKTPLERYFERIERERGGVTNMTGRPRDMFGNPIAGGVDGNTTDFFGNERRAPDADPSRNARRMTNSPMTSGLFSTDPVRPRDIEDFVGKSQLELEREKAREARMETFRKLIGAESYSSPSYAAPRQDYTTSLSPSSASSYSTGNRASPSYATPSTAPYSSPYTGPGSSQGSYNYSEKSYATTPSWQSGQASASPYSTTPSYAPAPMPSAPSAPRKAATFKVPERRF